MIEHCFDHLQHFWQTSHITYALSLTIWLGSYVVDFMLEIDSSRVTGFLVTGLETLPTFRPDAPVFFALKKTGASGRNVGKVSNPVTRKPVT